MSDSHNEAETVSTKGKCATEWKKKAPGEERLELAEVRERLSRAKGPLYWRSLEEVAGAPEFEDLLHREFPRLASEWPEAVSRRGFLQLAAASLSLAGLSACTRQPIEKIIPYVRQPEDLVPGRPLFFATSMALAGIATGILVESHEGRPTKIEGNPQHPSSLGGTDAVTQAAILSLYDPDRSQAVTYLGEVASWPSFTRAIGAALRAQDGLQGAGLRLLTGPTTSPTGGKLVRDFLGRFPKAKWHRWDPLSPDHARRGTKAAFGRDLDTHFDLAKADVIAAFESDLLAQGPGSVRYAHDFAARRKIGGPKSEEPVVMNRLYVVESSPTPTGATADHRLATKPSEMGALLASVAAKLGIASVAAPALAPDREKFATALAKDLAAHRGASLVVVGESLPAEAHTLAHVMNATLGNLGTTVIATEPLEVEPTDALASLADLAKDIRAGTVDFLIVSGANPAYDAPADLGIAELLGQSKIPLIVHFGLYNDETARFAHWHLPAAHFLESWGDARAYDGTISLQQPLIEPLYGGKSEIELLSVLSGRPDATGYDLLAEQWKEGLPQPFDTTFRKALHDGFVAGSALPAIAATVDGAAASAAAQALAAAASGAGIELAIRPDPSVLDGRFANNGWLQELPKPITKLTWDNVVALAPKTAERLKVEAEEIVELSVGNHKVRGPVWILPGQAEDVATVALGYGRTRAGRVADGVGFSAYAVQTSRARWNAAGASIASVGESAQLATTQGLSPIDWMREETEQASVRHVIREATLEEFEKNAAFATEREPGAANPNESIAPGHEYTGYSWGMVIDLNACVGCNACILACQSENNIPVVGREQVRRGRAMHWIRVDRYFKGDVDAPAGIAHQPLLCMQCEQAPCETVCPVAATTHSSEGLNDMVYNRCVGTRYCLNNCPYKVRRFNFLLYQDWDTEQFKLMRNPDVTVRSRGVMEKCTYCVQRINRARIQSEVESRTIRDGEIATACQQACPAGAIAFGNINDKASRVSVAKTNPRNYSLLEDLGTRPRTTYLALVKNPNPELA